MGKSKKASKKTPRRKVQRPKPTTDQPQWGEPILVGTVGKLEVVIRPPLNEAAARTLTQEQMILLVLEYRLSKIEQIVKKVQEEMDLHGRLSRLEAAVYDDD